MLLIKEKCKKWDVRGTSTVVQELMNEVIVLKDAFIVYVDQGSIGPRKMAAWTLLVNQTKTET